MMAAMNKVSTVLAVLFLARALNVGAQSLPSVSTYINLTSIPSKSLTT